MTALDLLDAGPVERLACERAIARGRRRERHLTVAMAEILARDSAAAATFVRILIGSASPVIVTVPDRLYCKAERPIDVVGTSSAFSTRDADLFFWSTGGETAYVVEAKLNAPLGKDQLEDYLRAPLAAFGDAIGAPRSLHVLLVCNRALALTPADPAERFVGSRVWLQVLRPLRAIAFESTARAARWRAVLDCYRARQGFAGRPQVHLLPGDALDLGVQTLRGELEQAVRAQLTPTARVVLRPMAGHWAVRRRQSGATAALGICGAAGGPGRRIELELVHRRGERAWLSIVSVKGQTRTVLDEGPVPKTYPRFLMEAGARLRRLVADGVLP
jgi:hypothetical protein